MDNKETKYKLCTIEELAQYLGDIIIHHGSCNNDGRFDVSLPNCDFAIAEEYDKNMTLKDIASISSGWFGVKKFDAGFDSIFLCLITDYYGGSCAQIAQIYEGESQSFVANDIKQMITNSMSLGYATFDDTTKLIVEITNN